MGDSIRDALTELVALKDLKDEESRLRGSEEARAKVDAMRDDYNRRKPAAWAAARAALVQPAEPNAQHCVCPVRDTLDAMLCDIFKRRAAVEEELMRAAKGKAPIPDAAKLMEWAHRLGVPSAPQPAEPVEPVEPVAPITNVKVFGCYDAAQIPLDVRGVYQIDGSTTGVYVDMPSGACAPFAQPKEPTRTGWPPGMLQDDSRELSRALASKPDAMRHAREAAAAIAAQPAEQVAIGHDSRILHELAGAASLCWEPKPTGVFDTQKAIGFVESALKELRESAAAQPPEPVALTDEEINAVMESCLNDWDWRAFARAIERAVRGQQ